MAERKSTYHGLTSDGHGPDEHGLGGLASPEDPRDFTIADHPGYAVALATTFPSAWLEPNRAHCNGAPDRIRTCDLWVRNPTLYPLSYGRVPEG